MKPVFTEGNKANNGMNGTKFESAVVKFLCKKNEVQYTGDIEPEIVEDARLCAQRILKEFNVKKVEFAKQCGQNTSTEVGDIVFVVDSKTYRLEMKYIEGSGKGTWHNPSINVFVKEFPDMGFKSPVDVLDSTLASTNIQTEYQLSDNLTLSFPPETTVFQALECLAEPFYSIDDPEFEEINFPEHNNSPLGQRNDSVWMKNFDYVILIPHKNGFATCRPLKDNEMARYYKEDIDEEIDDEYKEQELGYGDCWKFSSSSEVVISPSLLYYKVLMPMGKQFVGYIGASNFKIMSKNKTLPQKVLSMICDKKESSGLLEDGKRPDFLVVFSRTKKSTSVFNCANYKASDSDEILFQKNTDNRYTIGNDVVAFTFQYAWRNGAFSNPVLTIQLK